MWGRGGPGPPGHLEPPAARPALQALAISLAFRLMRGLEWRLLNASFPGYNLTLQTHTIQTLAFKLGCDFPGLSLSSTTLRPMPQVRGSRGWGWPVPPLQKSSRALRSRLDLHTNLGSALRAVSCLLCKTRAGVPHVNDRKKGALGLKGSTHVLLLQVPGGGSSGRGQGTGLL